MATRPANSRGARSSTRTSSFGGSPPMLQGAGSCPSKPRRHVDVGPQTVESHRPAAVDEGEAGTGCPEGLDRRPRFRDQVLSGASHRL